MISAGNRNPTYDAAVATIHDHPSSPDRRVDGAAPSARLIRQGQRKGIAAAGVERGVYRGRRSPWAADEPPSAHALTRAFLKRMKA